MHSNAIAILTKEKQELNKNPEIKQWIEQRRDVGKQRERTRAEGEKNVNKKTH